MENDNTRVEENQDVLIRNTKPTGGFDGNNVARQDYACVSYAPSSFPPRLNSGIHHFFPDQMPTNGLDRISNSSHFNVSPIPNIELDSFGRMRNRMWTADVNMNHSHVKSLPSRNIVKPRLTQNPTAIAALPTHISIGKNSIDNTDVTLDEFLSNHPDHFGSSFTSGGVDSIGDRFENLDEFGRHVNRNSGSTVLFQSNSICFQTASGTSMDCINHNNASHFQDLPQELSGLNFESNSLTIPLESYVNSSPLSVFQRTQSGGPEILSNRTPGNHAAPLGGNQFRLLDLQQNRSKDFSMESLFGSPNTPLQQNQVGSGSYQFQLLDNGKMRGKNLSRASLLGRHSVQHSNETGSAWNESPVFPCSPSLRVSESSINDHLVGAESRTGQSSHGVCRPSLKRGAIEPPLLAPRAQRRRQVVQLPGQLSNGAATINTTRPIADSGPFLASSSKISKHNKSAVHQMFRKSVPTFAQPARQYSQSSIHRVKWEVSDEIRPTGKNCYICKRDVSFQPEHGCAVKPKNPPPVAILPCGHVFHDQCLEGITPGGQSAHPPCIPCAVGATPL